MTADEVSPVATGLSWVQAGRGRGGWSSGVGTHPHLSGRGDGLGLVYAACATGFGGLSVGFSIAKMGT